jgi:hypothetical protein
VCPEQSNAIILAKNKAEIKIESYKTNPAILFNLRGSRMPVAGDFAK